MAYSPQKRHRFGINCLVLAHKHRVHIGPLRIHGERHQRQCWHTSAGRLSAFLSRHRSAYSFENYLTSVPLTLQLYGWDCIAVGPGGRTGPPRIARLLKRTGVGRLSRA